MELYSHADPYKCYLHHPTPEVGEPRYDRGAILKEYYGEAFNEKVVSEVKRLFESAFRTQITFGQRHFAPSASWRDEHVTTPSVTVEPSRFAVRVHVFEKRASDPSPAGEDAPGLSTPDQTTIEDSVGRYLGFVALRPEDPQPDAGTEEPSDDDGGYDHVVEAEVTSPSHMQRPRYHLIMTTASSARMGVLPFKSAVYMAPRRLESRTSTCMHLAISQALHLVMSRFGCRPISQREFDAHIWQLRCDKHAVENPGDPNWPLLKHVGAGEDHVGTGQGQVHEGGAQLGEALKVMQKCSAGGFIAHFSARSHGSKSTAMADAWRCLTDVLANGLPVVMMVNHDLLTSSGADRPHAQLVFGMRLLHCHTKLRRAQAWENREDRAELPGEFIGHDVAKGPFFQTQADDLLKAAWDSTNVPTIKKRDQHPGVHFLVIGPRALKVDMQLVRDYTRQYMIGLTTHQSAGRALLMEYYATVGLSQKWLNKWLAHKTDWRYVTRFLGREELLNRPDISQDSSIQDLFPPCACFWVIEVWHPHESHGMRCNEIPAAPPPVLVWSNASHWQKPGETTATPQSGVLHWSFQRKGWVPVEITS